MLRTFPRRALLVWAALLVALPAGRGAATCHSTCTEELRACRRGCAELRASDRRRCVQSCRDRSACTAPGARARVLTWVQNECNLDAQGMTTFSQRLMVRRGNCDPVTAMELPAIGPLPDPLIAVGGLCPLYAGFRTGAGSGAIGLFQRLSGLPDGSGVVFELTND